MIGNFQFSDNPVGVAVLLRWGPDGEREGRILVPEDANSVLSEHALPEVGGFSKVSIAVCYAIFIAMAADQSFEITGDPTVWDPSWGMLSEVRRPANLHL